jgi:hypothetical protein
MDSDDIQKFQKNYPVVNALINIRASSPTVLVPDSIRKAVIQKDTGKQVNNDSSIGPAILKYKKNLFDQSYVNQNTAREQMSTHLEHTRHILGRKPLMCRTLPPLRVLYDSEGSQIDKVVAVVVLKGGELKNTQRLVVPDLIMTFFALTKTIVVTTCLIQKDKIPDFNIVITSLYALYADKPLTIEEFSQSYDKIRRQVLKLLILQKNGV